MARTQFLGGLAQPLSSIWGEHYGEVGGALGPSRTREAVELGRGREVLTALGVVDERELGVLPAEQRRVVDSIEGTREGDDPAHGARQHRAGSAAMQHVQGMLR
jgi:hypothetical protein